MTKPMNLALVVLALFLSGCAAQIELAEPSIRSNVLGTWSYKENDPPAYTSEWFTFNSDGSAKFTSYGGCLVFDEVGEWVVSGDTIRIKINKSNEFQAEREETYKILLLTTDKLKLKNTQDGQTHTFKRTKS